MCVSGFSRWSPRVTALTERTTERRRRASADWFHPPVKSVTESNHTTFKYYTSCVRLQLSAQISTAGKWTLDPSGYNSPSYIRPSPEERRTWPHCQPGPRWCAWEADEELRSQRKSEDVRSCRGHQVWRHLTFLKAACVCQMRPQYSAVIQSGCPRYAIYTQSRTAGL